MPAPRLRLLGLSLLLALGLLLLGWLVGGVAFGACDENLRAGTTRSDICSSVGTEGSRLVAGPELMRIDSHFVGV